MLKQLCSLLGLALLTTAITGQDYLTPADGYKAIPIFSDHKSSGPFDIYDSLLYISDGDTIRCMNLNSGLEAAAYSKPEDYNSYCSFVTVSPDGTKLWAGFTVFDNSDDRIYSIDLGSGDWFLKAKMPNNFDLLFWNDAILVSGLNSNSWLDPGSVFVLDTSGMNNHRKIVEIGGYSAGLALDQEGNLFYGTSLAAGPNSIFRWDSTDLARMLDSTGTDTLFPEDAMKLTDLPSGVYDCDIDEAGNLVFNFNNFAGDKVMALWNGMEGDGFNFDTLSVATGDSDWLGMIKTEGNIKLPEVGNRIFTISVNTPVLEVHRDYVPFVNLPLPDLFLFIHSDFPLLDISKLFTDPDDPDSTIIISVESNSNTGLLDAMVILDKLSLTYIEGATGVAEIILVGRSGEASVTDTFLVTVDYGLGYKRTESPTLELFPNPNNGRLMVTTNSLDPVALTIHRLDGTIVYKNPFYRSGNRIDISGHPAGNYIIRMVNAQRVTARIFLKH